MARQRGIIKLDGTIGDVTFYKSRDGFLAREKGGIPADRIANDPAFQRTRENGAEFGRAGKAGKLLRTAIRGLLVNSRDAKMVGRLTREMVKVIQADVTSIRGLRNVIDGESELLAGFDFNANAKVSTTIYAPFTTTVNRVSGQLIVELEPFIPANMIAAPSGATHYKIVSSGGDIDFESGVYHMDLQATPIRPWDNVATPVFTLENSAPAASTHPLFLVLGIEFYQQVNAQMYPLKNGAFNALSIVKVDSGV